MNKDGFVSGSDLHNYLTDRNILNAEQADVFLKEMNIQKHQILGFKEFHTKIAENFSNMEARCKDSEFYNVQALKSFDPRKQLKGLKSVREFYTSMKEKVIVRERKKGNYYSYKDRFKYTPQYKNTFVNMRPLRNSKVYYQSLFRQHQNTRIQF